MLRLLKSLVGIGRIKRVTRISTLRFYSTEQLQKDDVFSIGFVNVFKAQSGRLRMTCMPKGSKSLAKSTRSPCTKSTFMKTIKLYTDDVSVSTLPVITWENK